MNPLSTHLMQFVRFAFQNKEIDIEIPVIAMDVAWRFSEYNSYATLHYSQNQMSSIIFKFHLYVGPGCDRNKLMWFDLRLMRNARLRSRHCGKD